MRLLPLPRWRRTGRLLAVFASAFAAVTCDLVTAPKPGEGGGIVVTYTGDTVLVVGTVIPLRASVAQGSVPIEGARLRLTTSDSAIVRVVDRDIGTDSIIVVARGRARIRATLQGSTLGDTPPFAEVEIRAVAAAVVIDDSTSVTFRNVGDTLTLRPSVFRAGGVRIDSTVDAWVSLAPTIVTVDNRGRMVARSNGTTTVRATVDTSTTSIQVTVNQRLARYQFSPAALVVTSLNQDTVITVTPLDAGGTAIPGGTAGVPVPTFTSLNTGVITVTTLSATTFRVSSLANDTTRVRVTAGTVDTTYVVTVGQVAQAINIQGPVSDTIVALQDTLRVRARAFDARNVEVQGRPIIWTSLNTSVVTVSPTGLVTAQTLGTGLVTARLDAALDTVAVVVQDLPQTIRTTTTVLLPTVGDSVQLSDTVLNKLGARLLGTPVSWRVLDTTVAAVGASNGIVVGRGEGRTTVIGSLANGAADTTDVTVENRISTVTITQPPTTLRSVDDTLSLAVDFRNARGAPLGASAAVWSSSDSATVSVANGFVTARRQGFADVRATDPRNPARFSVVRITVTNAVATIELDKTADTLTALNQTLQYSPVAKNARGALVANANIRFRTVNTSLATISQSGVLTARGVGSTLVIAEDSLGAVADSATIVIFNTIRTLSVTPKSASIASVGGVVQLSASAANALGGTVQNVAFTWTSDAPTVAQVDTTGRVTGQGVGTANVTVQAAGLSDVVVITVQNAPDTIDIQRTLDTLRSVGDTLVPPVVLKNALGAVLPSRAAAEWVSSNPLVASVDSGVIIARARGRTLIIARNALNVARRDSMTVEVTDAPDSVDISPAADSLPSIGRTRQFVATVFNRRRGQILNEPLSWSSSNGGTVLVSTTGLATSAAPGAAFVRACAGAAPVVCDSARVAVSNFAATVTITPGSATLRSLLDTVRLTATARNEIGGTIAAPVVTWASASPGIATVSGTGLVTAQGVGVTSVSATVNSITTSIAVTVGNAPDTIIVISSADTTLRSIGDVFTPVMRIRNSRGDSLPVSAVTWTSTNPLVATVSGTGVITATGAGVDTVVATSPGNAAVFARVRVVVTNAPVTIAVTPAGTTTLAAINATASYTAIAFNAAAVPIASPSPAITWASSLTGVATINATTGVATAVAPGTTTITATAGAASATATLTVAPAASPARSTITASPTSLTANGTATSTITVQAKDASGVNLTASGGAVVMTLTGTGTLSAVTNNNNGTYTATLTAPTAPGSGAVSATIAGAAITTGDPLVTYTVGAPAKYLVAASSHTVVAGTNVTVTAQLADAFNNPVPAVRTVNWTAGGVGGFTPGTSSTTNASGLASITYTTSTTAGTAATVTATDNASGAIAGSSAQITTVPGAPANYLVTASTQSPAAGSGVTVTAQLRDANNNAISQSGTLVNWTKSDPNGAFSAASTSTNAAGVATVTLTTHTVSGTATTVTATSAGPVAGTSGTITTFPGVASAAMTTITAGAGGVASGSALTVTVQAKDAQGNNLTASAGAVTLAATRGTLGAVTDVGNGSYTATFTGTSAGTAIITGTLGGTAIAASLSLAVTAGPPATVAINAGDGQSAFVSAPLATAPSVLVRDAAGNPVSLVNVTFTLAAGNGVISPASPAVVQTNGSGIAALTSWTMRSTAGAHALTAAAAGVATPAVFAATALAGPASAALSTISASAGSFTAGGSVTITVQLKDAGGNNLTSSGGSVALATTLGSIQSLSDNANGTYTATLSSTISGTATVSGTLNGATITSGNPSVTVNVGAASAAQTVATVPSGSAGTLTTITVQARDAFGNNRTATSGTVLASVTGANNTAAAVADNVNGTYTVTYTPTTAGADAIAITLGGVAIQGSPYTSVVTTGGLNNFLVEKLGGGNIATQVAGTPFDIRITARDIGNNTVTSFSGTVTLTSTGTLTGAPLVSANFVNGVLASQSVTMTNTGSFTITATNTAGAQSGVSNSFTVNPGALDHFAVTAPGGGAIGTQTAGASFNVLITAQDANNNTVTSFSGPSGGGNKVILTSTGTMTGAPITTANFSNGTHTQAVTITNTGSFTITATRESGGSQVGTSAAFTVNPGALANFLVEAAGGGAIGTQSAGTPFNIRVTARDGSGNTVTSFDGAGNTVDLTSTGTLTGAPITTGTFTSGVLASQAVTITNTGSFTITATRTSGGAQSGTSAAFTVNVGPVANFLVEAAGGGAIGTQAAGTPFNIRVTARDAGGNTVTGFTGAGNTVDLTSTGTLTGAPITTGTFTNGVLASQAVTITNAGSFTITATRTSGGAQSGTSAAFTVNPGALANFLVEAAGGGAIGTQTAGTAFNIQVTARDANGNTVTGFTGAGNTVDLTSTGTLTGAPITTGTFTNGVLASQAVTITNTGSFTITATRTSGGAQSGTSAAFTVNPGALANFLVEAAGGGAIGTQTAGTAFNIQVTARDANGNTVTGFTGAGNTVDLTSTGTLTGAPITTGTFTNGVLASQAVTITNTGSFTITATRTSGGAQSGTSAAFTVNPGTLASFLVEASGGGAIGSQADVTPFSIQVTAKDALGNTVTAFTGTVDITLNTVTGTGSLTAGSGTTLAFTGGVLNPHSVTVTLGTASPSSGTFNLVATLTGGGPSGQSTPAFTVSN